MKRMTLTLLFLFTVALAGLAVADDMGIKGIVVSSSGSTLVIRTDAGQEMTFFVDSASKNSSGLGAGQLVTVNYDVDGGRNHVTEVVIATGTPTGTNDTYTSTPSTPSGTSTYSDTRTGMNTDNTSTTTGSTYNSRYNSDRNMPATASPLALLALGGLTALGSGAAIRGLLKR